MERRIFRNFLLIMEIVFFINFITNFKFLDLEIIIPQTQIYFFASFIKLVANAN